jgi:hypothetical protein
VQPTRRRGSGLLATLVLLAGLGVVAVSQLGSTGQARVAVERSHLRELARLQVRSAADELRQAFLYAANTPGTPLFEDLRKALDQPWEERDVTALLPPPRALVNPRWGHVDSGLAVRLAPRPLGHSVRLRAPRRFPGAEGGEEWVGLLSVSVRYELADVRRKVVEAARHDYEARMVRPTLPPPFDQVALYLGDLAAATDVRRAAAERERLLRLAEELRRDLEPLAARDPEVRTMVERMVPDAELAARTPELPSMRVAVHGPTHIPGAFPLGVLDLASSLTARRQALEEARQGLGSPADPAEAAFRALAALDVAVDEVWQHRWQFPLTEQGGEGYRTSLEPYLSQLSPETFRARAHRRLRGGSEALRRWLGGEARLDGVALVRASRGLELSGRFAGRLTLVVEGGPVRLKDLHPVDEASAEHHLVVVALGGDLEVTGAVEAAVVALPAEEGGAAGKVRLRLGSTLRGSLVAPHAGPGDLELEGSLEANPLLRVPLPPSRCLELPGGGPYVVVVDPAPLMRWAEAP